MNTIHTPTAHTPGPWEINNSGGPISIHADDGAMICGLCYIGQDNPHSTPNAIHNARLIAAAPDLLAACKRAIDDWHTDLGNMERPEPSHLQMARDAVAKAEGRP